MAGDPFDWAPVLFGGALAMGVAYAGTRLYPVLWRRRGETITPTGFGAFLALYTSAGAALGAATLNFLSATVLIVMATAIYWLDDAKGLSVRLRLAIQFSVGAATTWLLLAPVMEAQHLLACVCLGGGVLNVVLTNVVNFYDGADLNLAVLVLLTAICMLAFGSGDPVLTGISVMLLAFVVPFALVNRVPRSLYMGDSGAFALACLLTIMASWYLRRDGALHPLIMAPIALPLLDTAFVFLLRIARKENLLSRNWHHLYQRLQIERSGFLYLAPQAINLIVVVLAALALERLDVHRVWAAALAMSTVTPALYFGARKWLLKPAPVP
jgi:UDP-GlcNAc:undecaprenyl-phosphate GlcNAc-1-phosphate transferase